MQNYSLMTGGGWSGDAVGGMAVAPGYAFGGWDIILTHSIEGSTLPAWSLTAGGQLGNDGDSGYWIMEAAGSDTNGISALTYLTEGYLGLGLGTPTATIDPTTEYVTIEDIAVGTVAHSPLAFGGATAGNIAYFDAPNGLFSYPGSYEGRFGTTYDTLFSGAATPVIMMGQATLPLGNQDQAVLVGGSFESNENYSNAATSGYVAGIWRGGLFTGQVASLYLDAEGKVGYLTGAVDGTTYLNPDGTTMWLATGDLTADVQQTSSGLTTFSTNTSSLEGGGLVSADNMTLDGNPIVSVQALEGEFLFITDPDTGLPIPEAGMVWAAVMGGTYLGPVANDWTTKVGGSGTNDFGLFTENYYWLGALDGTQWGGTVDTATENDLAATATARMLSQTYLYTMAGDVLGTFTGNEGSGTWQAVGIGTQTSATPLAMSGIIESDSLWGSAGPETGLSMNGEYYWDTDPYGLIGATVAPWEQAVPMVLMGEYSANDPIETAYLWHNVVSSYDVTTGNSTTFDNGAFGGYVAGSWRNGGINGYLAAIYLDPAGNAGVLVGDLLGSYFPKSNNATSMFEADGTLTPIQLASNLDIAADTFYSMLQENTNPTLTATVAGQFIQTDTDGTILDSQGALTGTQMAGAGWQQGLPGQDWGLLMLILDGTAGYTPDPDYDYTEWGATISGSGDPNFQYEAIASGTAEIETGATYGDITGRLAGAWVDIDRATTGVAGGKIMGSFDPTNANWQAVALGVGIETTKFLAMAAQDNLEGQAKLAALDIPNVEIGRTTLSNADVVTDNLHVTMTDVTFFAFRAGDSPKIWATGSVSGSYTDLATVAPVSLSGTGFSNVNFDPTFRETSLGSNSGMWNAMVATPTAPTPATGTVGDYTVTMKGAAAGTFASGSFNGTGSGVVPTAVKTNP